MKGFTPSSSVRCYLVTPPSYRPQVHVGIDHVGGGNLACYPGHSSRPNASLIELGNGQTDVYRLGDDRNDVSLELTSASDETMQVIEELIRRDIPVCIYPRDEGSVQASLPLIRGIGVDAEAATVTHTLTLATGTSLYLPHADAGRMVHLDKVAAGAYPLMDGFPIAGDTAAIQCPLGRGMFMPSEAKNLLKNSNLAGACVDYVAAGTPSATKWVYKDATNTWDTTGGLIDSPWHDGKAYWTRSTANTFISPKFDLTTTTDKQFLISFGYRVSGSMTMRVYNASGTAVHAAVVITSGTGRVQWPVPVISGSALSDCTLQIILDSGEIAMFGAPQLISASPDAIGEYPAYLGTDTAVQGEITASQLKVLGDFGMDTAAYVGDGSTWDGYICVSGYIQPGYSVAYKADKTIAFLEQYLNASVGDVELRLRPGGSFYEVAIFTGGTRRAGSEIATPRRGEAFAWVLYTGRENGALASGGMLVNMSTGASYLVEYAGGIGYANRLYIGSRSTAGYGADSLLSGVTVSSVSTLASAKAIASRIGSLAVADLFRRTAGRWYRLEHQTTPRRFDRRGWSGTLTGREVKAI